jgi:hypothetical protein
MPGSGQDSASHFQGPDHTATSYPTLSSARSRGAKWRVLPAPRDRKKCNEIPNTG